MHLTCFILPLLLTIKNKSIIFKELLNACRLSKLNALIEKRLKAAKTDGIM